MTTFNGDDGEHGDSPAGGASPVDPNSGRTRRDDEIIRDSDDAEQRGFNPFDIKPRIVMSNEGSRAAADHPDSIVPSHDDIRDALYADLEAMHTMRSQIDALESQYLATLRQLEVGQQLGHRLSELGPSAELSKSDLRKAAEFARLEVGTEWAILTRTSPASGPDRVERARQLVEEFPTIHAALGRAEITTKLADAVCEIGTPISDDATRARYEAEVLEIATTEGITPQRLRPRARRVAERLMASTRAERHQRAAQQRKVFVVEQQDGMSELVAILPSVLAAGIHDRLTQVAKHLSGPDEPRCFDELRADVFSALLLTSGVPGPAATTNEEARRTDSPGETGGSGKPGEADRTGGSDMLGRTDRTGGTDRPGFIPHDDAIDDVGHQERIDREDPTPPIGDSSVLAPHHVGANVMIVVPALSLLELDEEPATLNGMTPIPLADAALLAAHAPSWTRVLTSPTTGAPLAVDTYRPSAEQRAYLSIRDRHCRFPGCRAPARRCDIDHTKDWALGGTTDVCNLSCLCRTHHTRKHMPTWSVTQPTAGVLEWTTPSGRRVTDSPTPTGPAFTKRGIEELHNRARVDAGDPHTRMEPSPRAASPQASPPQASPPF